MMDRSYSKPADSSQRVEFDSNLQLAAFPHVSKSYPIERIEKVILSV